MTSSLCAAELANIEGILKAFDSCSDIFYKEMFLGEDVLAGILAHPDKIACTMYWLCCNAGNTFGDLPVLTHLLTAKPACCSPEL